MTTNELCVELGNCRLRLAEARAELAALRERAERAEAETGGIRGAAEHLLRLWDAYQADEGSVSPHDYIRCADFDALRTALAVADRPAPEPTP